MEVDAEKEGEIYLCLVARSYNGIDRDAFVT